MYETFKTNFHFRAEYSNVQKKNVLTRLLAGGMFEAAATPDGFFSKVMRTTLLTGNPTDNCTASIPPNCVIPNPVPQSGNPCTCGAQAAPPSNAANPTPQPAIAISDGFDILAWNIQRGRDFGAARKKHTDSYYCQQPYTFPPQHPVFCSMLLSYAS